jgi:hypothetical protein
MGKGQSSLFRGYGRKKDEDDEDYRKSRKGHKDIADIQKGFDLEFDIPMEVVVAHFTPSNFPLLPIVNKKTATVCAHSWELIAR